MNKVIYQHMTIITFVRYNLKACKVIVTMLIVEARILKVYFLAVEIAV